MVVWTRSQLALGVSCIMQPFYSIYGVINTLTNKHRCCPIKGQSVPYVLWSKAHIHSCDQMQKTIKNFMGIPIRLHYIYYSGHYWKILVPCQIFWGLSIRVHRYTFILQCLSNEWGSHTSNVKNVLLLKQTKQMWHSGKLRLWLQYIPLKHINGKSEDLLNTSAVITI